MATDMQFSYIINNHGNASLVCNSYIIPYCRQNKDGSINYKCRHHEINTNKPFPALITILNGKIVRGMFEHSHDALSSVVIKSKIALTEEKSLAASTRTPLAQIHS